MPQSRELYWLLLRLGSLWTEQHVVYGTTRRIKIFKWRQSHARAGWVHAPILPKGGEIFQLVVRTEWSRKFKKDEQPEVVHIIERRSIRALTAADEALMHLENQKSWKTRGAMSEQLQQPTFVAQIAHNAGAYGSDLHSPYMAQKCTLDPNAQIYSHHLFACHLQARPFSITEILLLVD